MENKFEIVPNNNNMIIEFSHGLFDSLVIPNNVNVSKSIITYQNSDDFIDKTGADIQVNIYNTSDDNCENQGFNIEIRSIEAKELERKQFKDLANEIKEIQTMVKNVPADEYAKNLDLFGKISEMAGGAEFLFNNYYGDNKN